VVTIAAGASLDLAPRRSSMNHAWGIDLFDRDTRDALFPSLCSDHARHRDWLAEQSSRRHDGAATTQPPAFCSLPDLPRSPTCRSITDPRRYAFHRKSDAPTADLPMEHAPSQSIMMNQEVGLTSRDLSWRHIPLPAPTARSTTSEDKAWFDFPNMTSRPNR